MNTPTISMCMMSTTMVGAVRAATGNVHWIRRPRVPIWRRPHHSWVSVTIASEMWRRPPPISIQTIIAPMTSTWMCTAAAAVASVPSMASAAAEFPSHRFHHMPTHRALCTANKCRDKHIVLIETMSSLEIQHPKLMQIHNSPSYKSNPWKQTVHFFRDI